MAEVLGKRGRELRGGRRRAARVVLVRDTQDRDGPRLAFPAGAWTAFLAGLKSA